MNQKHFKKVRLSSILNLLFCMPTSEFVKFTKKDYLHTSDVDYVHIFFFVIPLFCFNITCTKMCFTVYNQK